MRRTRRKNQQELFDNDPVYSHNHAAGVVGEFFEHLTAALFKGWRVAADEEAGYNPDIETKTGQELEAKASGRARWLVTEAQLETLLSRPGSMFIFWRYPYSRVSLIRRFDSRLKIYQHLSQSIIAAYAVSSRYIPQLLDPKKVDSMEKGQFLQVKQKALRLAAAGVAKLQPAPAITVRNRKASCLGITCKFPLITIDDGSEPEVAPPF